mmetsp:Transcript_2883/g.4422  ORF Transcript_2883/g.4422 Transcript_2883/m.4422 type:complete len:98 (+) Transcript_2883:90-383(+)
MAESGESTGATGEELSQLFTVATEKAHTKPTTPLSNDTQLMIYSLFKQATVGPCNTDKPGFFDLTGRAKHDAWTKLGEMSKEDAMRKYIEVVDEAYK